MALYKDENIRQIKTARYKGEEITLGCALQKLKEILQDSKPEDILHYRGNGNFGLMQEITDYFFASYGATLTEGSLSHGAGEAGIIQGRGSYKNMPLREIEKSEVVIVWGKNPYTTSPYLLPLLEGKKIIVIDPIETKIAQKADLYIQIKPRGDLLLALMLSRFLHIENNSDEEFLEKYASEYEDFYELTQTVRIKAALESIGVSLGQIGQILELIRDKNVAIACGVSLQRYSDGADIMRAIDAFAVYLGLFAKEGCGIALLGNTKTDIASPFFIKAKRVSRVNTDFSNFKTLFIQGANPLAQMPDTLRVEASMRDVQNVIYYGLYENESSQRADLVLPAKSFLYKNDIANSYLNHAIESSNQALMNENGISEYDLSVYLCNSFGIILQSEEEYLEYFKKYVQEDRDDISHMSAHAEIPYQNGFDTEDGEFCFLDEIDVYRDKDENFFLLTPKALVSTVREELVYLHSAHGYRENDSVLISSPSGSVRLQVRHNDCLRHDCVLIYSSTPGVNRLTSSKHSIDGKNAIYQENKVEISR